MNPLALSLEQLETAHLIRALTDAEHTYFFRHILIQASAYDTLLKQDRKFLHRAIAVTLEQQSQTSADELARHYRAAEMPDQAARYFTLAGQRARSRFENSEAITYFRAALDQEKKRAHPSTQSLLELHESVGDVLAMIAKSQEALTEYAAGLDQAQDALTRARLTRKIGDVHQFLLEYETTRLTYERALSELGPPNESPSRERWHEWTQIMVGAMNNNYWHGHWENVKVLIEQASPIVTRYGTPLLRAMFLDRVEMMHARRNRYVMDDDTRQLVVLMREAAEESGDAQQILNARFSMAFVELRRRDLDAAENEFLWSIRYAGELGAVTYSLWSMTYLAVLYRWRGEPERVRALVETAQKLEGALGTPWYAAGLANLAWIALRENNAAQARRFANDALQMWEPFGELYPFKTLALFPLLELARREQDSVQAVHYISQIQKPSQEKLDDGLNDALTRAQEALVAGEPERGWGQLEIVRKIAFAQGFI